MCAVFARHPEKRWGTCDAIADIINQLMKPAMAIQAELNLPHSVCLIGACLQGTRRQADPELHDTLARHTMVQPTNSRSHVVS
eukprot:46066-Eustigmatos_ZCMA.PRE.1